MPLDNLKNHTALPYITVCNLKSIQMVVFTDILDVWVTDYLVYVYHITAFV